MVQEGGGRRTLTSCCLKRRCPKYSLLLAQQVAEKYLKGLLIFFDKVFPKVHDLLELETLLLGVSPDIKDIHRDLEFLNRYYIETRYPGDYPEFTKDECQRAYEAALRVREVVLKKIRLG